jgi:hypothetical protein
MTHTANIPSMRDVQAPRYTIMCIGDAHATVYAVARCSDLAVAGFDPSCTLDDGAKLVRDQEPRLWMNSDEAGAFLTMLIDNVKIDGLCWITEKPLFAVPERPHVDYAF